MKGTFESCCEEFSQCGVDNLCWKFLEVADFPIQLSLNLVVLNMCSHFLNLTKLEETKIHDQIFDFGQELNSC
jgi:hypothetical protein